MSATLKPFDTTRANLGIEESKIIEVESPFPESNRKILIVPQVSSRYRSRSRMVPKFAEAIRRITSVQPGNYLCFFPSYALLNAVYSEMEDDSKSDRKLVRQGARWKKKEIDWILHRLRTENDITLFAVQGGSLAEGVDYRGEMAIGALIFGPGLSGIDSVQKKMEEVLGYDRAAVQPAMTKSIQAAGRVIRSESDKGVLVFLDDRFLKPEFSECFPNDWFESPSTAVSVSIIADLQAFWNSK